MKIFLNESNFDFNKLLSTDNDDFKLMIDKLVEKGHKEIYWIGMREFENGITDINQIQAIYTRFDGFGTNLTDWKNTHNQSEYYLTDLNIEKPCISYVNNKTIAEITQQQSVKKEDVLLLHFTDDEISKKIYVVKKDSYPHQVNIVEIKCVSQNDVTNIPNKNYQFKHNPKHDYINYKNGSVANPKDRQNKGDAFINRLLFPANKMQEYAEILLKIAITENGIKKLYALDNFPEIEGGKGKLVEFIPEDGIEENIYHAYHLEDIKTETDIDRHLSYLPNNLKKKLKELLKTNTQNQ
ncbi:MAG: hypothetical protein EAZ85_09580 [Bacteroidetes bacterium]|nr:MAG: hypothetical protein EAZ85_09580 [Bacteroidota bacterium]TAG87487.1 MAG: hypothetical protein EAZ20_10535 [Bacteroidota bacterium]